MMWKGKKNGCETRSLTLREGHRLKVFKNRVLRRIFRPRRDEMVGGWRKVHNEELHNLYSLPNIIRMTKSMRMRWAGHVACTRGEEEEKEKQKKKKKKKKNAYRILVGKPE
jgi:hypothetical protein